jgi:pimeloyl-ACP methyl ester carboxylesterase
VRQLRVQSGEIGINVVDWRGPQTRRALFCLHGITANARAWDGIARSLLPEIGVIATDLRGRGESDKPDGPYGIETHVRDTIAVLDAFGLERVAVAGWSLGSLIGMHLAATHPERVERLALVDPPLAVPSEQARESLGRVQGRLGRTYDSMEAAIEQVRALGAFGGWSDAIEAYLRADLEELPDGRAGHRMPAFARDADLTGRIPPLTTIIPKITCPVLILRATDELFQPNDILLPERAAEQAVSLLSDACWVDIPGTNHYTIALGYPSATIAALRGFIGGGEE